MTDKLVLVVPADLQERLEPHLPANIDLRGFSSLEEGMELAPQADIGWFDLWADGAFFKLPGEAVKAKWINTTGVGLDAFPTHLFIERQQIFTNGVGLRSDVIAEFAVLGVLMLAKRFDQVVRAHDRHEWTRPQGQMRTLTDTKALILGYGSIGQEIGHRLKSFGVDVVGVRRSPDPDPNVIGTDEWRTRLAEFDWIIVGAPATDETEAMLGAAEFAAMKPGASIVNIARGALIDQPALIAALESGQLGGAFLDPTTPEPLPQDDPLWDAPNTLVTMHMAGAGQSDRYRGAVERFLKNLDHFQKGEPLDFQVDFTRGY